MRILRTIVLVAAVGALTLTGCGSNGNGGTPGIASANGSGAGDRKPSASPSPSLSDHERALKFAQCMRENGVDVPDPGDDHKVTLRIKGSKQKLDAAMKACRQYAPPGLTGGKPDAATQKRILEYAKCMRQHGVDMPDPDPNQPGMRIDKKMADDPDFKSAQQACKSIMADVMKGSTTKGGGS